jgi:hypothetical protein
VKGYKIEFEDQPHQINIPKQINLNDEERHIIENESQKLLSGKIHILSLYYCNYLQFLVTFSPVFFPPTPI